MNQNKWDIDKAFMPVWMVAPNIEKAYIYDFKKMFGIGPSKLCTWWDSEGVGRWSTLEQEEKNIGNFLIQKFIEKPSFLENIMNEYKETRKLIREKFKEFIKKDISNIRLNEIFELMKNAQSYFRKVFEIGYTVEPIDSVFEDILKKSLKKYNISEQEFSELVKIPEQTFFKEEEKELLDVVFFMKKNDVEIDEETVKKKIKKHHEKWVWIKSGHSGKEDLKISSIEKEIQKINKNNSMDEISRKIKEINDYQKRTLEEKNKIIRNKKIEDKKVLDLINIINVWGPLHEYRKELFMRMMFYQGTLIEEVLRRKKIKKEDIFWLTYDEIISLENNELNLSEINNRKKLFVYYIDEKEERKLTGKEAKEFVEENFGEIEDKKVKEFKGNVANKGLVRGKVFIIHGIKDIVSFPKGAILVSSMTRPEFLPAIKKSSAIVTDEGGITCHAALISRELKIPCIIGTKIATKVLKDGDYVEVDANKGTVKVLKKGGKNGKNI